MSGKTGGRRGGVDTDGHFSHGGGGTLVTNQQLLVLDKATLPLDSEQDRRLLAIIQLQFARGVSELALRAYDEVLLLLGAQPGSPVSVAEPPAGRGPTGQ